MTVRWKPLVILSGLFVVIAVMGLMAIIFALPPSSKDVVERARAERSAKQFEHAEIDYKRAVQIDPQSAEIRSELAAMYAEWSEAVSNPAKKAELKKAWSDQLLDEVKFDPKAIAPRRALMDDALARGDLVGASNWARNLVALDARQFEAQAVLARRALDGPAPDLAEARKALEALDQETPVRPRTAWLKARLAELSKNNEARQTILAGIDSYKLSETAPVEDRLALVRLRAMNLPTRGDLSALIEPARALRADAEALAQGRGLTTGHVIALMRIVEDIQQRLTTAPQAGPESRLQSQALVDAFESLIESAYKKATGPAGTNDLPLELALAEHLRARGLRDRCLEVAEKALASPSAAHPELAETVQGLRDVSIRAALAVSDDPKRFEKAAPRIAELLNSSNASYQGVGHLYQGAIDLERSGLAGGTPASVPAAEVAKLRASALEHLKKAAGTLTNLSTAQALYGVALILSKEPGLGRQYLQKALTLGEVEPRYRIWAAWSMLQAGYPEDAAPLVARLLKDIEEGRQPREISGMLWLLRGEILQARRNPADLAQALQCFEQAMAAGVPRNPALEMRLAQLELQLNKQDNALKRIQALRAAGQGGPTAEYLAVVTLLDRNQGAEAVKVLDAARAKYPQSSELAALAASILIRDKKYDVADQLLAAFLERNHDDLSVTLLRTQLMAERLNKPQEARSLLAALAEKSENTGPTVQLALLDLGRNDLEAASRTIAQLRSRWSDSAVADLLDAQIALNRGDFEGAGTFFAAALKKDPNNKVAQFWKAQVESRNGITPDSLKVLEQLARGGSMLEVDAGLSLRAAAETTLAGHAMQAGAYDEAIQRYQAVIQSGAAGGIARQVRWQIVEAQAAQGHWPEAKREIAAILADAKTTPAERVRAATYYRMNSEPEAALQQVDQALKTEPGNAQATVARAMILTDAKRYDEAAKALQAAIDAVKTPSADLFLMSAAVENLRMPAETQATRALAALDRGLERFPQALPLIEAKYRLLTMSRGTSEGLAYVEKAAEADTPTGKVRRLLVDVLREQGELDRAERLVAKLIEADSKDAALEMIGIRLALAQANRAAQRGDTAAETAALDRASQRIKAGRDRFPKALEFPEAECDLALRKHDFVRALALTQEIDTLAPNRTVAPLLRARIQGAQGHARDVVEAYAEAVRRSPFRVDLRLALGQAALKADDGAEAITQADWMLERDPASAAATLLKTRAMLLDTSTPERASAARGRAIALLAPAVKGQPRFLAGARLLAELQRAEGRRAEAIQTLETALKAGPEDPGTLGDLIRTLCEAPTPGQSAPKEAIARAEALAKESADRDRTGAVRMALAEGFAEAGQVRLAIPLAESGADKLDDPDARLMLGNLWMSQGEALGDSDDAKTAFRKALDQYDRVLAVRANSIAAVNNKAWILHRYLGNHDEALRLIEGLRKRLDEAMLPAEVFDTLGAIREAVGQAKEAEDAYAQGLRKAPGQPMLNFHMGRLLARDARRKSEARDYLNRALSSKELAGAFAAEIDDLLRKTR